MPRLRATGAGWNAIGREDQETLDSATITEILGLRLLIARAAQPDSLRWWNDNSLTAEGLDLTARLFGRKPERAALRLALKAARVRHDAAMPHGNECMHLFNFGDVVEFDIAQALKTCELPMPNRMESISDLLTALSDRIITGDPEHLAKDDRSAMEIVVDEEMPLVEQARILASGYVAGDREKPVFPFIRMGSSRSV